MGLDMYLNAKRFLWHNEEAIGEAIAEALPELKGKRVREVIAEAMYWRKANAIHKWFVDNVQNGVDDCGSYWVSREQLEELRELVLEVIKTKNASRLPPCQGFFFGSDKIDDWYWADLKDTEEGLARVLAEFPSQWDFEYRSSW